VKVVEAPTAADLARETLARADADLVLMAAAVADYRPADALAAKRPKDERHWDVKLEPTADILRELAARRSDGQILVGFAADAGNEGLERARAKLRDKGVSLFVFNDISRPDIGFDAADNEVVLLTRSDERTIGKAPKEAIAAAILDEVGRLLEEDDREEDDG
jgi:phosphopantothenoylcysteine decarboxylase/phosphopantothenate--cysteine ligase